MKLYLGGTGRLLAKGPRLRGESAWVLLNCEAMVGWGNLLPTPAKMGGRLGQARESVARAYRELLKTGFILKYDGSYYLSPAVGWRGTAKELKEAQQLWYGDGLLALPMPSARVAAELEASL